jgi:peroxiredoxin
MHFTFTATRAWRRLSARVLPSFLLLSLLLNIVQAGRLRALTAPRAPGPGPGTIVPPLRVRTAGGESVDLLDPEGHVATILYYFSGSCGWCERNWRNVAALEHATRGRYRFMALSASDEDLQPVAERHGLEFPLHTGAAEAGRRALGLAGTPQTIVVSPEGRVLIAWVGAYGAHTRGRIERYFRMRLPGLAPRVGHTPPRDRGGGTPVREAPSLP